MNLTIDTLMELLDEERESAESEFQRGQQIAQQILSNDAQRRGRIAMLAELIEMAKEEGSDG